jgi:hypothetical protein
MGAFEERTASKVALPSDLPKAAEAAREHPDGAIYKADDGKKYRLRHASWAVVTVRAAKNGGKPAAKK